MDSMDHIAKIEETLDAPASEVWRWLVEPERLRQYMAGADVSSDWKAGSEIVWKGEWQGKTFEDRGRVVTAEPGRLLEYTHASGGAKSEHRVTIALREEGGRTRLTLTQDGNATEEAKADSEKNWRMMFGKLASLIEGEAPAASP
jgi:uncharacterized protein YndB with AHSA1/START domain